MRLHYTGQVVTSCTNSLGPLLICIDLVGLMCQIWLDRASVLMRSGTSYYSFPICEQEGFGPWVQPRVFQQH